MLKAYKCFSYCDIMTPVTDTYVYSIMSKSVHILHICLQNYTLYDSLHSINHNVHMVLAGYFTIFTKLPPWKKKVMFSVTLVLSVCLSVCLSVGNTTQKVINALRLNCMQGPGVVKGTSGKILVAIRIFIEQHTLSNRKFGKWHHVTTDKNDLHQPRITVHFEYLKLQNIIDLSYT